MNKTPVDNKRNSINVLCSEIGKFLLFRAAVLLVAVHAHALRGDWPVFVWTIPSSFTD